MALVHSSCNSILPLRHQAWKEVGLVIPQGTLPGAHCDRGGPPTWVGRLARTDGSPCICRGATTTTTHPLGWVALHCRGCTTHMFPPTRRGTSLLCRGHAHNTCSPTPTKGGQPCYTGAMHAYHGRSACMQGQTIIIYLSGRAAHAHTLYNPPPTSYIAYNPSLWTHAPLHAHGS